MRNYQGLPAFAEQHTGLRTADALAIWLAADLQYGVCGIYGKNEHDALIPLAHLPLDNETWEYSRFEQRIDFISKGQIVRNDFPPLLYRVQGQQFSFNGRCSMIGKVCGVDLYLNASYTAQVGDFAQQRFSIPLKLLLTTLI